MPIKKCTENGQEGWSWGNGKCFVGENGKKEAIKQAVAIGKGKFPEDIHDDDLKLLIKELEKEYEDECKNKKVDKTDSVNRFDVFELTENNMVEPFRKTSEGYLRGRAIVTNIGIFNYTQFDGSILRELRTPENIGNQETLDSLIMQVMTDNHPETPNGNVNSDNAKELQVGFTGENVKFDGCVISIPITITDKKTVEKIEKEGKIALSCGYDADLEMRPGFAYGNNAYDAIQKNIRYNHIALVDRGRAGDLAKLKLRKDSYDAVNINYINSDVFGNNKFIKFKKGDTIMSKIRLNDNVEFEVDKRVEDEFDIIKKTNEDLDKLLKIKNDELSILLGKYDSLLVDYNKLKTDKETLEKEIPAKVNDTVKNRIAIVDTAIKFGVEINNDMDNLTIKKEIVKKAYTDMNLEGKDEVYISSVFDAAVITLDKNIAIGNKEAVLNIKSSKETNVDVDELRKRRDKNLWKLNSEQGERYRKGIIDEEINKILEEA